MNINILNKFKNAILKNKNVDEICFCLKNNKFFILLDDNDDIYYYLNNRIFFYKNVKYIYTAY